MAKKKLRPGIGAKCTILTKFIHPKKTGFEEGHRTKCILKEMKTIRVNQKDQQCFVFEEDGKQFHAVRSHFKVYKEGKKSGCFNIEERTRKPAAGGGFQEPKIKWRKSKANKVLYDLLRDGTIPLQKQDGNGNTTMTTEDIFALSEEFLLYDPNKFEGRLEALRKKIVELDTRASEDRAAFDIYKKNHEVSLYSHKGYIQWQGSDAQDLLWNDIEVGKLETMTKEELWQSRDEYMKKQ